MENQPFYNYLLRNIQQTANTQLGWNALNKFDDRDYWTLPSQNLQVKPFFKEICIEFQRFGKCTYGAYCQFTHENPRPAATRQQPTNERLQPSPETFYLNEQEKMEKSLTWSNAIWENAQKASVTKAEMARQPEPRPTYTSPPGFRTKEIRKSNTPSPDTARADQEVETGMSRLPYSPLASPPGLTTKIPSFSPRAPARSNTNKMQATSSARKDSGIGSGLSDKLRKNVAEPVPNQYKTSYPGQWEQIILHAGVANAPFSDEPVSTEATVYTRRLRHDGDNGLYVEIEGKPYDPEIHSYDKWEC
ncbi:unnamed protein product, partial [Mesorhabditis spiculigera]